MEANNFPERRPNVADCHREFGQFYGMHFSAARAVDERRIFSID
jgi:hypothetical protein